MTVASREYRVRWQREGRQGTGAIYQTLKGAEAKRDRLLALEEDKHLTNYERAGGPALDGIDVFGDVHGNQFEGMPDLVGPPVIEWREVGVWSS